MTVLKVVIYKVVIYKMSDKKLPDESGRRGFEESVVEEIKDILQTHGKQELVNYFNELLTYKKLSKQVSIDFIILFENTYKTMICSGHFLSRSIYSQSYTDY